MQQTATPEALGFDSGRLARIDSHFASYVDSGKLAGWQIVVARRGEIVHASTYGLRDREAGLAVEADTLWRLYSMTKPIVSVAAMSLWEQGKFQLTDELSRYLPEFADVQVMLRGSITSQVTAPPREPIRLWHLLTHTSGLTAGFLNVSVVDALHRAQGYEMLTMPVGQDLAAACKAWAALPLLFEPGTAWSYSVATDVLGRVLEVVTGKSLDAVVDEQVLGPLGMSDTRWFVAAPQHERLAAIYTPDAASGMAMRADRYRDEVLSRPQFLGGGGGLICTAADYHRFTTMLLRGGELDGTRVLGNRTLRYMTRNHLPRGADLGAMNTGGFAETNFDGIGFGLGFAVVDDAIPGKTLSSQGEFFWGGLASTAFWVDPVEEVTALLFTQLVPSSTYPLRPQLRQLVYSALVD
ncbi:MAG TPA: serine hydrolase domain-containing protein [Mycobacteriales bacterium]|nr:serine hydrolase domain-containing protein [Mycobacteriales bacterium]